MSVLGDTQAEWERRGIEWRYWIRTPNDERAACSGYYPVPELGERTCRFISCLRLSSGVWAGRRIELMDWQRHGVLMPLFSWVGPDGARRFRWGRIWIPKKNGKTELTAAIGNYLFLGDREPGSNVVCIAASFEQASIAFDSAANMIRTCEPLAKRVKFNLSTKRMMERNTTSSMRVMAADAATSEGARLHGMLFDELHVQPNRRLWDSIRYAGRGRRQPMFITTSTAGFDRESLGWNQYQYSRKVLDGSVEDVRSFSFIAAAAENDDWRDPEIWRRANPSMGVLFSLDDMRQEFSVARESVADENAFRRYLLNQWVQQEVRWINMADWDGCLDENLGADPSAPCYGGLDFSINRDLTAFALLWPPSADRWWRVRVWFWCTSASAKRRDDYRDWIQRGHLTSIPGNAIDHDAVLTKLLELAGTYNVREIGMDPWNTQPIFNALEARGYVPVMVRQGAMTLSGPSKTFEKLIRTSELRHDGNPILRWNVENAKVEIDKNDNIVPRKPAAAAKIDGVMAAVIAMERALKAPVQQESAYNRREVRWL